MFDDLLLIPELNFRQEPGRVQRNVLTLNSEGAKIGHDDDHDDDHLTIPTINFAAEQPRGGDCGCGRQDGEFVANYSDDDDFLPVPEMHFPKPGQPGYR